MKTLETERLILRDFRLTDLDDFFEYASIEGVGEMAGWPHHENKEVSKSILEGFIKDGDVFAIVLKENNKVIGSLGIHSRSKFPKEKNYIEKEIGYVLSKDYWGRGLVPEAVKSAIVYAFDEINVDILWCGHFLTNNQSKRVIEKSGFKFYENGVFDTKLLNKSFEDKIYIMTREDYSMLYNRQ